MYTIAIIDDDEYIGNMLEEILTKNGYAVLRAYSGTEALLLLTHAVPDLVLLDLMLPGLSGEELLPQIQNLPVIVISAKVDVQNKVHVLLNGAVDYLTKPFDTQELLARIQAHLRTFTSYPYNHNLTFQDIILDMNTHTVTLQNQTIHLTRTEYAIMKSLMQYSGQVISKSTLLERICEDTPDCTESTLKVHISNLRRKLREIGNKDYIETIWGIGFKLQ